MDLDLTSADSEPVAAAYAREAVDDFMAAAASEQARLRALIADAEARTRRARAAVGMHRVMVGMLFETQHQIAEQRAGAEADAADILGRAEEEAQRILREARTDVGLLAEREAEGWPFLPVDQVEELAPAAAGRAEPAHEPMLDLNGLGDRVGAHVTSNAPDRDAHSTKVGSGGPDDDRFFAYLRGALHDDQPLGPRAD
jgi:hypothetical protein